MTPKAKQVYDTVDPIHATRDHALIAEARALTRLQAKRRALKGQLRIVDAALKVTQRNLKALMRADHSNPAWEAQAPKSKLFGETE